MICMDFYVGKKESLALIREFPVDAGMAGAICWVISQLINHTGLDEIYALSALSDFAEGAASGMVICGLIVTSCYGQRIKAFKQRVLKRQ